MFKTLQTLILQYKCGLVDSLSLHKSLVFLVGSRAIQIRFGQCLLLNGVLFLGSLLVYTYAILPVVQYILRIDLLNLTATTAPGDAAHSTTSDVTELVLLLLYRVAWLYPIYVLSFLLSTIWYADIGTHTYELSQYTTQHKQRSAAKAHSGRTAKHDAEPKFSFEQWLTSMAEELYRQLISFTFFVQTELVGTVPSILCRVIVNVLYSKQYTHTHSVEQLLQLLCTVLYTLHLSWYYALYAYDYKWSLAKLPLLQRLHHFEQYWAYYAGYGATSAVLTLVFPRYFNTGIFALTFPLFLILAIIAVPVEQRGAPTSDTSGVAELPLFALSKTVNYRLLQMINHKKQ